MIRSRVFFTFILSLLIAYKAIAADFGSNSIVPVEWQAIRLQESIEDKIKRSLLPLIKPEDYVIEVKIGLDTDKVEDPSSKKVTKNTQRKKVRFSNAEMPKEGDDFVVFNKIGLEAPIVGEEPVEIQTSEIELAQKAMIEMNDRYNLFNYLSTIDINLSFDKNLPNKTKESIQKVVRGLSFNTKDVVPQINTQYLDLKSAKMAADPTKVEGMGGAGAAEAKKENSALDRFKNLDIMVGLIIAALMIAAAMIFIARKGSKHEEESKGESKNEDEVTSENTDETHQGELIPEQSEEALLEGEDMGIDLTKTDPMTLKIVEGLERFRKVLNHHYNDMALMLKSWIKIGKGEEAVALRSLVQMLNDSELAEVFKCLTIDERTTWKMCLNGELTKDELGKSFQFISNQIIQTMMVPSLIDDYEICDLLLALRAEDAARYAEENSELGVIFANVLSAKTIGEMLKMLPVEASADIIEQSAFFKKEDILNKMPVLKEKMLEFKARRERPPFIKRIVDILPTARPQLEKKLYSTLLKHLSMEDVKDLAVSIFPSDLLTILPDGLFKEAIAKMPLETQIQYFLSLSDEDREASLNRFAPKGSKSRDMVEVELTAMLKNEILVNRIRTERKEMLEMEFLGYVRDYLTHATEAQKEVVGMIESWLKEIKTESDSNEPNLKIAA